MNRSLSDQIGLANTLLPLHPQTARISAMIQELKGGKADESIQRDLEAILEYHKKNRLGKEHEKKLLHGNSSLSMLPTRGCVVTDLTLDGKSVFFHNPKTIDNMDESLRGSFWMVPYAGPAPRDTSEDYDLQHGYGRTSERRECPGKGFQLDNADLDDQGVNVPPLEIYQDALLGENNRAYFTLDITNRGNTDLVCAPGFHAYYNVPLKEKKHFKVVQGIKLDQTKLTQYLLTGKGPEGVSTLQLENKGKPICIYRPSVGSIKITMSRGFSHVWIRTEKGKPFVCIEPVARGGRYDDLPMILPGEQKKYWLEIKLLGHDK